VSGGQATRQSTDSSSGSGATPIAGRGAGLKWINHWLRKRTCKYMKDVQMGL